MKDGKLVPDPSEYEEMPVTYLGLLVRFALFYVFIFFPLVAIHQETVRPGAIINNFLRKHVYGQGNLHDYLADDHLNQPYDDEVPECDFKTMTPKQFYLEYVGKGRPCLFKEYGKQ